MAKRNLNNLQMMNAIFDSEDNIVKTNDKLVTEINRVDSQLEETNDELDKKSKFISTNKITFLPCIKEDGVYIWGDCTLIQTENKNILIDGGDDTTGIYTVNLLRKMGINKINTIIITHNHSDHIGGLPYIIDNLGCDKIYGKTPTWSSLPPIEIEWQTKIYYDKVISSIAKLGLTLELPPSKIVEDKCKFDIFNIEDLTSSYINDYNGESLAIKIEFLDTGLTSLLCGDITAERIDKHISKIGHVDIWKLAHHGDSSYINKKQYEVFSPRKTIVNTDDLSWQYKCHYLNSYYDFASMYCIIDNLNDGITFHGYLENSNINKTLKPKNTWIKIEENSIVKDYYFNENGNFTTGFKYIDSKVQSGNSYFFNSESVMLRGWIESNNSYFYARENDEGGDKPYGSIVKNEVKEIDGKLYYFDINGRIVKNNWVFKDNNWYYCDSDGYIIINRFFETHDNRWCLSNVNGVCVNSDFSRHNEDLYYFDGYCYMVKNSWVSKNGNWYYCGENGGVIENNLFELKGDWYYALREGGLLVNGWVKKTYSGDVKYMYFNHNGKMISNCKLNYNGILLTFGTDGFSNLIPNVLNSDMLIEIN